MERIDYDVGRIVLAGISYATRFKDKKIPRSEIARILELARWAPSNKGRQPWSIIVVDDPVTINKVASVLPEGRVLARAPVLVAVVTNPVVSPDSHLADGGSLAAYIIASASLLGYSVYYVFLGNNPVVRDLLGVPRDYYLHSIVAIGEPEYRYPVKPPKPLNTILYYNRYGLRY